uniref:Uncharacterized protein n=1 Tax=Solanum lycopersicum TaxID=4081 RepID=K4BQF7_SOLLC
MEKEKYSEELNVGVRVVHMACSLCQKVQKGLLGKAFGDDGEVKSKDDDSLVTIAGNHIEMEDMCCSGIMIFTERDWLFVSLGI